MYFRELGLIREMQCWILQQISYVKYEEVERSVHLSAIESKGTCVHVCTHGVHLHGELLAPFLRCLITALLQCSRKSRPAKDRKISCRSRRHQCSIRYILAFKPVFYFVYTTKLLC